MPAATLSAAQEPDPPATEAAPSEATAESPPGGEFESLLSGIGDIIESIEDQSHLLIEDKPEGLPIPLSVREAVSMALEQNPQVLRSAEDVNVFFEQAGQTRASMKPQIGIGSAYIYQENANAAFTENFLTRIIVPGGTDVEDIHRADRLTIEQLIFAGGTFRFAARASDYLAYSQQWRRAAVLDALEFSTKQAYYDCLTARALVVVAEDSVVTFERHLKDTRLMLEVGEQSQFEVIRAQTELQTRKTDVINAKNRERLAYTILRRLLNIPQDTPIELTDRMFWVPLETDRARLTAQALENRPEIRALRHGITSGEYNVRSAKGAFWPRVAATGEWTNFDGAGSFVREGWTVTLGAELDLYAGGRRKHEREEAQARLRGVQYELEEVSAIVEEEVMQAFIHVENAIARIVSENQNVKLASEGGRLALLRFQEEVGTQVEVLDAELALTDAQKELVVALREYAVAQAGLDRAIGRSWVARDFEDDAVQVKAMPDDASSGE